MREPAVAASRLVNLLNALRHREMRCATFSRCCLGPD